MKSKKGKIIIVAVSVFLILILLVFLLLFIFSRRNDNLSPIPKIEETVLADQDGTKVTAMQLVQIKGKKWGLQVRMENDTEKLVGVQCVYLAVNHLQNNQSRMEKHFFCFVEPHSSDEDVIYFDDFFDETNMSTITDVELSIRVNEEVVDPSTGLVTTYNMFETQIIQIDTITRQNEYIRPEVHNGQTIYDENGIKVVLEDNQIDGWRNEIDLSVFVENDSTKNLVVKREEITFNGKETDKGMWISLEPGYCSYDMGTVKVSSFPLKEEDPKELRSLLTVIDADTHEVIYEEYIVTNMK